MSHEDKGGLGAAILDAIERDATAHENADESMAPECLMLVHEFRALRVERDTLRETLRSLLSNQPAGHRFARAMEGDCLCRWCKAHRVLGYDAWPDAPPVERRVLTIDLGHVPKMNDDEAQCYVCGCVRGREQLTGGRCALPCQMEAP